MVLCTTTAAADPAVAALPPFDVSIVDEAGQATQPNCWLPLLRARRAVLVGDPRQLAPTILSAQAAAGGLGTSLMEAAMSASREGHSLLRTQYRMHQALCGWASGRFYDAQLAYAVESIIVPETCPESVAFAISASGNLTTAQVLQTRWHHPIAR